MVRDKLFLSLALATLWAGFSVYVAVPWMTDLANAIGWPLAIFVVTGVALIPGYSNAFIVAGLLFDHRPQFSQHAPLPALTVLVAAYNEQECIGETLASFAEQHYDAPLEITVIDDGSPTRPPNGYGISLPPPAIRRTRSSACCKCSATAAKRAH